MGLEGLLMRRLVVLLGLIVASAAHGAEPDLAGTWTGSLKVEEVTVGLTFEFRPDQTYRFIAKAESNEVVQSGTYTVKGTSLALKDDTGTTTTYVIALNSDSMTISGGDLGDKLVLKRTAIAAAKGDSRLVGRWNGELNEFHKVSISFLPGGTVAILQKIADVEQPAIRGSYRIKEDKIIFNFGDKESEKPLALTGNTLKIEFEGSGVVTLEKEAGSTEKMVALEADLTREDAKWKAKFAVGPLERPFAIEAVGQIPSDSKFERAKAGTTVFSELQLYFRDNSQTYVSRSKPTEPRHSHIRYYFLPNGRIYLASITYLGSDKVPEADSFWGTYYIDSERELNQWGTYTITGDQVQITWDDNSVTKAALIDGRRNLKAGSSVFGNVIWEQEALKRKG